MNFYADAKPMDSEAAKGLPELKALVQLLRTGGAVAPSNIDKLRECLHSGDAVLVSIASWCVYKMGQQGDSLQRDMPKESDKLGDMASAFVTLAKESKSLRQLDQNQRKERLVRLTESKNSFLRVEAAKEVVKIDRVAGKKIMAKLVVDLGDPPSATQAIEASRQINKIEKMEGKMDGEPASHSDELYETVLSVID